MANEKRLIDANALMETARKSTASKTVKHAICIFAEIAPTVDAVEVVHGYWEKVHDDLGIDRGWKCSHCNGSVYKMTYESYQYCPNCGAKMDGGEDDG